MNQSNLEYLKEQVRRLGFPDKLAEQIDDYAKADSKTFHIHYFNQVEEDQLMYDLRFVKDAGNNYQLKEYELTYKQINVPDLKIQGIHTKELDQRLKLVDSLYDRFLEENIENSMSKEEFDKVINFIQTTNNDLYKLTEPERGEEVAKLLMFKYFPESEYEKMFPDYKEMQRRYEHKHGFSCC